MCLSFVIMLGSDNLSILHQLARKALGLAVLVVLPDVLHQVLLIFLYACAIPSLKFGLDMRLL